MCSASNLALRKITRPTINVLQYYKTCFNISIHPAKSIVQLLIMKLVVQIPAYNEAGHLSVVLSEIPRQIPGVDEVIVLVIDDGSTDNTAKVALENGADYVLRHRRNRGLSRAFISGVQFSLLNSTTALFDVPTATSLALRAKSAEIAVVP